MTRATLDMAVALVWSGFYVADEVMEMVLEHCFLEDVAVNADSLHRAVRGEFAHKLKEQEAWPALTDCDRLDQAFAALNRQGVIGLHNVGFSESEGLQEIHSVYVERGGQALGVRGYCFYHAEDVERAVAGLGLYLSYGASDANIQRGVEMGATICASLCKAGLVVHWDGEIGKRLHLLPLAWQRR